MFVILNLMSDTNDPAGQMDFDRTVSVLGYGLLPIIGLAIFHIFVPLQYVPALLLLRLHSVFCFVS
jgi:hypothetical protein